MLQEACFRYYWDGAEAHSGMTRETPGDDRMVATGASGFGIAALVVAQRAVLLLASRRCERLTKYVSFVENAATLTTEHGRITWTATPQNDAGFRDV